MKDTASSKIILYSTKCFILGNADGKTIDWFVQPWKKITVVYWKDGMDGHKRYIKLVTGDIVRSLQFSFSCDLDYVNKHFSDNDLRYQLIQGHKQYEFILELICKEECEYDEMVTILQTMASRPASAAKHLEEMDNLPLQKARQINERKALVFYEQQTVFCVAQDEATLDRLLFEMGYCETDTYERNKNDLDLQALGLQTARLHPNLNSIGLDKTSTKWVFVWKGRKKEQAADLIKRFISQCKKIQIVFQYSNKGTEVDWTNLAVNLIFVSKRKITHVYLPSFNRIWDNKTKKSIRFFALETSNNQIWLYSPEDQPCVEALKAEVEASITRHTVSKDLMGHPEMTRLLTKHKPKLSTHKYDSKSFVIVCTSDINVDVLEVLTKITDVSQKPPANDVIENQDAKVPLPNSKQASLYRNKVILSLLYFIKSTILLTTNSL